MGRAEREMPKKVEKYVINGTWMINIVLLLCHVSFGILFYLYQADVLFAYNCISIITYLLAFEILRRKKAWIYACIVFVEIFIFMLLAIVCLGWDYGFQHYCIAFVASMTFADYYMDREKGIGKRSIIFGAFNALLYVALRFWTDYHPYIYQIDNKIIVKTFYVINTLCGFAFLIMYLAIYSNTVFKLESELRQRAERDHLTGLYNRRKMMQILKTVDEVFATDKLAMAMLDVDFFKKINDTYGHDVGDEVLRMLSRTFENEETEEEPLLTCRWGGEEFLIFYNQYKGSKEEVIKKFEQLRQTIENSEITYNNKKIKCTVTIGLAFYQKGTSMEDMIKEADELLYEGKKGGRNRVVCRN